MGVWLAASPAQAQSTGDTAKRHEDHSPESKAPPPQAPQRTPTAGADETSHDAMVEEQERRDREEQAERDRDDQA